MGVGVDLWVGGWVSVCVYTKEDIQIKTPVGYQVKNVNNSPML